MDILLTIVIGLIGGVAVGMQSPIAGTMSQRVGSAASSLVVHVSGAILSAGLLLIRGGEQIQNWRSLPWYMLGSGVFGVLLYLTLSHTLPRLGATAAVVLIIVGQLLTGLIVDHFGLLGVPVRPTDGVRIIAALLLLAGGYLMVK